MPKPFLTARWENLLLLNYRCPSELLDPFVPRGTELDLWRGASLISLVGFSFLGTRIAGVPLPGHGSFEEVNLRLYVRRIRPEGLRRGVVFVRELVPRRLVAAAARFFYNEPYVRVPMSRNGHLDETQGGSVTYSWVHDGARHSLSGRVAGPPSPPEQDSEAEFITEHYWGYNRQRDGSTLEYRVEHPTWSVWHCSEAHYAGSSTSSPYGDDLAAILEAEPVSAFVAKGSAVRIYRGSRVGRK